MTITTSPAPATTVGGAGGSTTQLQFNSAGALAGDSGLTWDNTNKMLSARYASFGVSEPFNGNYVPGDSTAPHALTIWNVNASGAGDQLVRVAGIGDSIFGNNFHWQRAKGLYGALTALTNGTYLMSMGWRGYGATQWGSSVAAFQAIATENWTDTAQGIKFHWDITPNGSATRVGLMDWTAAGITMLQGAINDAPTATVASAGTPDISGATVLSGSISLTGTTTVTGFAAASQYGVKRLVVHAAAHQLTHNGTSFDLLTGANITTAAGDVSEWISTAGGWKMTAYTRKSGAPLVNSSVGDGIGATSAGVNAQTGTTYTYVTGDAGKEVTHSNASSIAGTLPQAGTTGFASGWSTIVKNKGNGVLTITPTTSAIDGAATLVLRRGDWAVITSDGTNYDADIVRAQSRGVIVLTSSTAIAVDASLSDSFSVTLGHNTTFSFSNLVSGQAVSLLITQDGTGSRTGAWSGVLWAGGTAPTLSTAVGKVDLFNGVYFAGVGLVGNLNKAFS